MEHIVSWIYFEKDTTPTPLYNYITRLHNYDNILYVVIDLHSYLILDIESTIIISSIKNWSWMIYWSWVIIINIWAWNSFRRFIFILNSWICFLSNDTESLHFQSYLSSSTLIILLLFCDHDLNWICTITFHNMILKYYLSNCNSTLSSFFETIWYHNSFY